MRKYLIVFIVFGIVAAGFVTIANFSRVRAQHLLAALQTIRVGTTTFAEMQVLARQHHAHLSQPCEASLCRFDFPLIENTVLAKTHLAPVTRFGGLVTVKNGKVSYMTVGLDVTSRVRTITSADVLVFPPGEQEAFPSGGAPFSIHTTWGGAFKQGESDKKWKTIVTMTSNAVPELQRAAFDFNLSCLTRLGGCTDSGELLPELPQQQWRNEARP